MYNKIIVTEKTEEAKKKSKGKNLTPTAYSGIILSLFWNYYLMVRNHGVIGALGYAQARFFHPSAKIRDKWPNDHKRLRLERVVVTGK